MERNQRLSLALEIKNPDLSSKLGNPTYSQFLKDYARQNPTFVANAEKALSELVTSANQVCPAISFIFQSFIVAEILILSVFLVSMRVKSLLVLVDRKDFGPLKNCAVNLEGFL